MKPFNEHGLVEGIELKRGEYGLHGDVCIFVDELPADFDSMPEIKDSCLAYGEATGHAHKIFGEPGDYSIRECQNTKIRYLHVVREVVLKHQEHKPVVIPPGKYRTGIQREYDPFSKRVRQVID